MSKAIFITGAFLGFGKILGGSILERGDKVAATARALNHLADLVAKYARYLATSSAKVGSQITQICTDDLSPTQNFCVHPCNL